jgi:hypothetical protein
LGDLHDEIHDEQHACEGAELLGAVHVKFGVIGDEVEDYHHEVGHWYPKLAREIEVIYLS